MIRMLLAYSMDLSQSTRLVARLFTSTLAGIVQKIDFLVIHIDYNV
jgi:hypothetical protein